MKLDTSHPTCTKAAQKLTRAGTLHFASSFVLLLVAGATLTGCTNVEKKFHQFEKLGITHAEIQGKFSSTEYNVEKKEGRRIATLDHNNGWFPKIKIVRDTAIED